MLKLNEVLKASKTERFPDYWTLLWGRKLSAKMIKTLTGTLPLTFRTSETALRSWTIYGNDFQQEESKSTRLPLSIYTDEDKLRGWTIYGNNYEHKYSTSGTLPLTFTAKAGAADTWTIYGNNENGTENEFNYNAIPIADTHYYLDANGKPVDLTSNNTWGISEYIAVSEGEYVASGLSVSGSAYCAVYDTDKSVIRTVRIYPNTDVQFNIGANDKYVRLSVRYVNNEYLTAMLVKGSTAPDHYIPYQKGVGERTKNLLDIVTISGTRYDVTYTTNKGTYTLNGTATNSYFSDIATFIAEAGKAYMLSGCAEGGGNSSYLLYTKIGNINYFDRGDGVALPILETDTTVTIRIAVYSGAVCDNVVMKPMVRETNTSDTFIPYGYQIPLTVSQDGQTDKTVDIYIGDTPLTEGETVSKQSTGVDLELFEGSNTVSTTLYNKPAASITYTDYLGVGEYVNGQWQIPLTVSDGTNTTTVNVPIDAPLTASDTATKTSTGVDIPTYVGTNTISTTLENKPEMLVYYGYKGAGEHSGNTWEFNFITQANGNQQLTKITMDKPLRAGETLTSEQASKAIPTYADAENTLSLYPSAAGYGNPEMTITYKGG